MCVEMKKRRKGGKGKKKGDRAEREEGRGRERERGMNWGWGGGVAEDKSMCSHVTKGPVTHKRILDFILRASGGHCRISSMTTWGQVHWIQSALLLSHFMLGTQYVGSWSSVLSSCLFLLPRFPCP